MNSEYIRDNIILPARKIIRDDSKIKKYYLFPGLLSVIFLTTILTYQAIYTYVVIGQNQYVALEKILVFLESKYVVEVVIIAIIFLVLYFLSIPIFEGGLIKYIECRSKGFPIGSSEAFGYGLNRFLPVFEYDNLFSEFKLISILNFFLFTIRFIGVEYMKIITIVYVILGILGIILNILFIYSKYAIVINKKLVFSAIGESVKVVILNLKVTIKLYFLIFFLNFRVLINFFIFLFFPILIVVTIGLISTKFLMIVAVTILSIIFITLIFCVSYLTAVLDVFKTALWYFAYEECKKGIESEVDDEDEDKK